MVIEVYVRDFRCTYFFASSRTPELTSALPQPRFDGPKHKIYAIASTQGAKGFENTVEGLRKEGISLGSRCHLSRQYHSQKMHDRLCTIVGSL